MATYALFKGKWYSVNIGPDGMIADVRWQLSDQEQVCVKETKSILNSRYNQSPKVKQKFLVKGCRGSLTDPDEWEIVIESITIAGVVDMLKLDSRFDDIDIADIVSISVLT